MATQDPTTNYSWNLPTNGGDPGAWGTALNAIIGDDATGIDAVVKAVSVVADAALPKAGGVLTGNVEVETLTDTVVDLGSALTGTVTLDCSLGQFFHGTMTDNITIAFSNVPASGKALAIVLEITRGTGTQTISFGAEVKFSSNITLTTELGTTNNRMHTFLMYTRDGGTKWRASVLANMVV